MIKSLEDLQKTQENELKIMGDFVQVFKKEKQHFKEQDFTLFELVDFIYERKYSRKDFDILSKLIAKLKKMFNTSRKVPTNEEINAKQRIQLTILGQSLNALCHKVFLTSEILSSFIENLNHLILKNINHYKPQNPEIHKALISNLSLDFTIKYFDNLTIYLEKASQTLYNIHDEIEDSPDTLRFLEEKPILNVFDYKSPKHESSSPNKYQFHPENSNLEGTSLFRKAKINHQLQKFLTIFEDNLRIANEDFDLGLQFSTKEGFMNKKKNDKLLKMPGFRTSDSPPLGIIEDDQNDDNIINFLNSKPRNFNDSERDFNDSDKFKNYKARDFMDSNYNDNKNLKLSRNNQEFQNFKESKGLRNIKDVKGFKESRDFKDYKDKQDFKDSRDIKDFNKNKEDNEIRDYDNFKESRDFDNLQGGIDFKNSRDLKTLKDTKETNIKPLERNKRGLLKKTLDFSEKKDDKNEYNEFEDQKAKSIKTNKNLLNKEPPLERNKRGLLKETIDFNKMKVNNSEYIEFDDQKDKSIKTNKNLLNKRLPERNKRGLFKETIDFNEIKENESEHKEYEDPPDKLLKTNKNLLNKAGESDKKTKETKALKIIKKNFIEIPELLTPYCLKFGFELSKLKPFKENFEFAEFDYLENKENQLENYEDHLLKSPHQHEPIDFKSTTRSFYIDEKIKNDEFSRNKSPTNHTNREKPKNPKDLQFLEKNAKEDKMSKINAWMEPTLNKIEREKALKNAKENKTDEHNEELNLSQILFQAKNKSSYNKNPEKSRILGENKLEETLNQSYYKPEAVEIGKYNVKSDLFREYELYLPVDYYTKLTRKPENDKDPNWYLRPHHIETVTG